MKKDHIYDFKVKCSLLHAVTKLDVELIDEKGSVLMKVSNHDPLNVLQYVDHEYVNILEELRKNNTNSYYYFINSFGLEYISTGLWVEKEINGFILIGPFLSRMPSVDFISDIITKNQLPVSDRLQLQEFYKSLVVLSSSDSTSIGDLLVNLCGHEHVDAQLITSEKASTSMKKEEFRTNSLESKDLIELRYDFERKLMNAISKGDKNRVKQINEESSSIFHFADRFPESPIRSYKNLLVVLNTLSRKAAEDGGVHPVYLHSISEKFAILIERGTNLPYLKNLSTVMTYEYCDAVNIYSTHTLSPIVKKAVNYIQLHLESPLTLNAIAKELQVNPAHLSRKFKEETKTNVIDYINQKRIEEAKYYLQRGNSSITEIAFIVGFNDLNYFSRIFKKCTTLTPSQYMKEC